MGAVYRASRPGRMIARPDHLTVRPNLRVSTMIDTLSEGFRSVRLIGGIFLTRTSRRRGACTRKSF
jgi:hypothetical protein